MLLNSFNSEWLLAFPLLRVGAEANSSPISSSSSNAFDGITYYKINVVNSAPATTTGLGNAKFTPENNSNTGSVKITVGTTQEDIPITEQASEVTYQLALDSTGKPYVQVNVKKPDSEVTGTLNGITASWVKIDIFGN